jgi:hypothetical protein
MRYELPEHGAAIISSTARVSPSAPRLNPDSLEFDFIAVRLDVGDIPYFPRLLEGICGRWLGSFLPWSFWHGVRSVGLEGHDFVPLRWR